MREKRLFWISIIIVELVLLYVVWRPYRSRSARQQHRATVAAPVVPQPVVPSPETKPSAVVIASDKPLKAHSRVWVHRKPPIVNASLKEPEPIPAAPVPVVVPQSPGPPVSFWCDLAMITTNCDCKVPERLASNNPMR